MRRPTLDEKRYGPGFRDRLITHEVYVSDTCRVETCADPVHAIVRLYIDAYPPENNWYADLLKTLTIGAENDIGLCFGHAADVVAMDEEYMDNPDLWEPGRENPPVMPGPSLGR
jgi:hypothetical protein